MAEENKDRLEMWSMLAEGPEAWIYEPDAELLASNAYFQALFGIVGSMVKIKSELSLTDEEKQDILGDVKRSMASLVFVAPLYDNFLKNPISGSTNPEGDR